MSDKRRKNHHHEEENHDEFTSVKHTVKRKRTERKLRKKRKKVNHLKTFLSSALLVLLIFSGYKLCTLPQWYLPQDTFSNVNSERVEIINNKILPTYIIQNFQNQSRLHQQKKECRRKTRQDHDGLF